jgi:plasmid stabilization system protein ParE
MRHYELTLEAEADLSEIAQYTLQQWSEQQAMQYADALSKTLKP